MVERLLKKIKSGYISDQEVQCLVYEAHKISLAYLRIRVKRNDYILELMGGSYDDLAWDCVSELFERDENGRFSNIRECLNEYGADNCDQKNISAFRRMVFTKTNDTIFNLLGRYDSSLSKIIRNIKLAAADHPSVQIEYFGKDNHVVFDGSDVACGSMEPDILLNRLLSSVNGKPSIKDLLEATSDLFYQTKELGNSISVVQLAYLYRKLFVKLQSTEVLDNNQSYREIDAQERIKLLDTAILDLSKSLKTTYVKCDKLSEAEFGKLVVVAKQILMNRYVTQSTDFGYYEYYVEQFKTVSKESYREGHRSMLEYLVKKIENRFLYLFKKDLTV